jgi:hypothetical protein
LNSINNTETYDLNSNDLEGINMSSWKIKLNKKKLEHKQIEVTIIIKNEKSLIDWNWDWDWERGKERERETEVDFTEGSTSDLTT